MAADTGPGPSKAERRPVKAGPGPAGTTPAKEPRRCAPVRSRPEGPASSARLDPSKIADGENAQVIGTIGFVGFLQDDFRAFITASWKSCLKLTDAAPAGEAGGGVVCFDAATIMPRNGSCSSAAASGVEGRRLDAAALPRVGGGNRRRQELWTTARRSQQFFRAPEVSKKLILKEIWRTGHSSRCKQTRRPPVG